MSRPLSNEEFLLWRDYIYQRSGILLGEDKSYLIEHRFERLLGPNKCKNFGELYLMVRNLHGAHPLVTAVIDAITTNETFWFRDPKLFDMLGRRILPDLHQEILDGKREAVAIWSAACSTGQEPFSIAMTALEAYRTMGGEEVCRQELKILASDISTYSLHLAQAGHYDSISVGRGLAEDQVNRHFLHQDGGWVIRDRVRSMVEFRQCNLRDPISRLGAFDLVFLRNTLIYFSEQFKEELLTRIAAVMNPGGLLFLGTGENIGHLTKAFELVENPDHIYYRLAAGRRQGD